MRTKRSAHLHLWIPVFVLLAGSRTLAGNFLDQERIVAGPQSATERFTFTLGEGAPPPLFDLTIQMTQGRAGLRIVDPTGRQVRQTSAQACTVTGAAFTAATPGVYAVEVTTTQAVGRWHLRIYDGPPQTGLTSVYGLTAAGLMMLVALVSVGFWRSRTGVAWRWFWVGAAVWTVAVLVKFAIAIPLNKPVLEGLKASLPQWAYLATGTIYGGAMTGITEILFTLVAALIWRRMAATAARGVAVGIGAGAFEAALVAITVGVTAIAKGTGEAAWYVALAPAAERLLAILCHTASRALVLLAVASRRWVLFWYGFLLLSGLDAVATILHLTGRVGTMSPWMTEALLAPFGVVSIPITIWCIRRWPTAPEATVLQEQKEDAGVSA